MTTIRSITGEHEALLALGAHSLQTLQNLGRACDPAEEQCAVRVSPFCHEHPDSHRQVRGWTLDVPSEAPGHVLPISFNMFDGVTIVECEMSETEVLDVMRDLGKMKQKLGEAVERIMKKASAQEKRACWSRCRPSTYPKSLEKASKDKEGRLFFVRDEDSTGGSPVIDSEDWVPELSPDGFIGLHQHWHRSTRENRLCMYVICQSYLPKACLEYADLVHQVGEACTAGAVCLSEETQWVRMACARNRARLICEVCSALGIRVPVMLDYNARDQGTQMAIPLIETLHHDMITNEEKKVRILNYCTETRRTTNGTICVMAPWEGVWIFHGGNNNNHHPSSGSGDAHASMRRNFGQAYGGRHHLLPTASPQVRGQTTRTRLTFSSADPGQCTALQIWPKAKDVVVVPRKNQATPTVSLCSIPTEGLDPDVVQAFQHIMLENSCPQPFYMPNIPGMVNADVMQHLVFDEYVLNKMAERGWPRMQGVTVLTPMACALYEHWKKQQL